MVEPGWTAVAEVREPRWLYCVPPVGFEPTLSEV